MSRLAPWPPRLYLMHWGLNKMDHIFQTVPLIARFMGPTWGPSGAEGPRWAPCWPLEVCYLSHFHIFYFDANVPEVVKLKDVWILKKKCHWDMLLDDKLSLVQIIAYHQMSNKPIPETVVRHYTVTWTNGDPVHLWCIYESMWINSYGTWLFLFQLTEFVLIYLLLLVMAALFTFWWWVWQHDIHLFWNHCWF